jgi:hypothetical protein
MSSARQRRPATFHELADATAELVPMGLLAFSSTDLDGVTDQHRRVARELMGSSTSARTERVAKLLTKLGK